MGENGREEEEKGRKRLKRGSKDKQMRRRRPASSGNARPRLHRYATSYDVDPAQYGKSELVLRRRVGMGVLWWVVWVGLVEERCLRRDRVGVKSAVGMELEAFELLHYSVLVAIDGIEMIDMSR